MKLSRYTLKNIINPGITVPGEEIFELPEKVLQFGTGVLLRGLPDYFIDKANRQGIFNGRIVIVKSTSQGDSSAFEKQDGLFTLCVRGLKDGEKIEENIINSSISRVLSAQDDWKQVLDCAHNPEMKVIISNTTEVGIQLVNDDISRHPPVSYPGKLLAFLHERFTAFNGSPESGMVIVPTELILDNGKKLESIVLELAHLNSLEDGFIEWLENSNYFCNSLVDRIVPGKPDAMMLAKLESELGYNDELLSMSEVYRLWAIEGGEKVRGVLSFSGADEGVVIAPDIRLFRELKLRLLNGTHTLSCGLAFLAGCGTVKNAMDNELVSEFISGLMQNEVAPAIPFDVDIDTARDFGRKVLDRFRNPEIKHQWISITVQYSSKMKMRCIPILQNHYSKSDQVPELFVLGFAAYLAFMRPVKEEGGKFYGKNGEVEYLIQDDEARTFFNRWASGDIPKFVHEVLGDSSFWGNDLTAIPGFSAAVKEKLRGIHEKGMIEILESAIIKRETASI